MYFKPIKTIFIAKKDALKANIHEHSRAYFYAFAWFSFDFKSLCSAFGLSISWVKRRGLSEGAARVPQPCQPCAKTEGNKRHGVSFALVTFLWTSKGK
jgi:hypothetical protein